MRWWCYWPILIVQRIRIWVTTSLCGTEVSSALHTLNCIASVLAPHLTGVILWSAIHMDYHELHPWLSLHWQFRKGLESNSLPISVFFFSGFVSLVIVIVLLLFCTAIIFLELAHYKFWLLYINLKKWVWKIMDTTALS